MIYVDQLAYPRPGGKKKFCHMFASSLEELHAFAEKIGRKRCWFDKSKNGIHHYDLDEKFRKLAVESGAQEMSSREYLLMRRKQHEQKDQ